MLLQAYLLGKDLKKVGLGGHPENCLERQDVLILDWHSKQPFCPAQAAKALRHLAHLNYRSFR